LPFVRVLFVRGFRFVSFDFRLALAFIRSGSLADPVSRFHSSNVLFDISPLSKSSANFLRCAWLLNGITFPRSTTGQLRLATSV
jgi:hypothetical protein